jgi:UDP-glucose 4-epimerase
MTLVRRVAPQVIVHLASEVAGTRDHRAVLSTMHSNLSSAVHLLAAAVEQPQTRVVLAGSMEEPTLGTAPPSPYAAAKSAATGYGRMFHELWRLPVTTLRVAMVYGPGQRDRLKLVPYAITSLLSGEPPRLSSGRRKIDWVYVDDVVDAFVKAIEAPTADGAVLDIGSGTAVSIRDTVSRIVDLASPGAQPHYGAVADRQSDEACIADPTAAEEKIGWRASTPLDQGLARTVDWFREHQ